MEKSFKQITTSSLMIQKFSVSEMIEFPFLVFRETEYLSKVFHSDDFHNKRYNFGFVAIDCINHKVVLFLSRLILSFTIITFDGIQSLFIELGAGCSSFS